MALPVDLYTSKALIILLKSLISIFKAEIGSILYNFSYKYLLPCILQLNGIPIYYSNLNPFSLKSFKQASTTSGS